MSNHAAWEKGLGKELTRGLIYHFKNHSYCESKEHRKQAKILQKRKNGLTTTPLAAKQSRLKLNLEQNTEDAAKKLKYFTSLCNLASSPAKNPRLKATPRKTAVMAETHTQILMDLNRKALHLDPPGKPPGKCEIARQSSLSIPPKPQQSKESSEMSPRQRRPQRSITTTTTEVVVIPRKNRSCSTSKAVPPFFPYFFIPIYLPETAPAPPSSLMSKRVIKPKETEKAWEREKSEFSRHKSEGLFQAPSHYQDNSKPHDTEKASSAAEENTITKRAVDRHRHYSGLGQVLRENS